MGKRIAAVLLCAALLAACLSAGAEGFDDRETVDAGFKRIFKLSKAIGATVVVGYQGEIVYQYNYGFASKGQKKPVTDDTYFRVASVTKLISAIGAMQLVEQGKLALDEDLSAYYGYTIRNPRYPKLPLTLRQLMTHTSGISTYGEYDSGKPHTIRDMLESKTENKVNYEDEKPGYNYHYSNFGGGMIGSLMVLASGENVNDYMRENVFEPLDIDASYDPSLLKTPGDMVTIYKEDGTAQLSAAKALEEVYDDSVDPENHYNTTVGRLWMRAADAAKLGIALCGDGSYHGVSILSPETVALMRADQKGLGEGSVQTTGAYGLCVNFVEDTLVAGKTIYGHQGMYSGVMTDLYYDPDTQFVLVMFSNGCSQVRENRVGVIGLRAFQYAYSLAVGDP